jgi:hypothetical protein
MARSDSVGAADGGQAAFYVHRFSEPLQPRVLKVDSCGSVLSGY